MNQEMKTLPVLIMGTAGAAKDIYYWIKAVNKGRENAAYRVLGFVEASPDAVGNDVFDGYKVVTYDEKLGDFIKEYDKIGMVVPFGMPKIRERIVKQLIDYPNVVFPNIIHPTAVIDPEAGTMGIGNHIGPAAVFVSAFTLGNFNYVSGNALLGHDIVMGDFNSVNPSASTAGNVTLGNRCMLGIGSSVIQELKIDEDTTIGAGAVLTKNTDKGKTWIGIPAKPIK